MHSTQITTRNLTYVVLGDGERTSPLADTWPSYALRTFDKALPIVISCRNSERAANIAQLDVLFTGMGNSLDVLDRRICQDTRLITPEVLELYKVNKWYVVLKGRNPGIYVTWDDCYAAVSGWDHARYKSFVQLRDALLFYIFKYDVKRDNDRLPGGGWASQSNMGTSILPRGGPRSSPPLMYRHWVSTDPADDAAAVFTQLSIKSDTSSAGIANATDIPTSTARTLPRTHGALPPSTPRQGESSARSHPPASSSRAHQAPSPANNRTSGPPSAPPVSSPSSTVWRNIRDLQGNIVGQVTSSEVAPRSTRLPQSVSDYVFSHGYHREAVEMFEAAFKLALDEEQFVRSLECHGVAVEELGYLWHLGLRDNDFE